jgi:hypothetical protein
MDSEKSTSTFPDERTKKGFEILEAALITGVLGDVLLRAMPWGLNVFLWGLVVSVALWVVASRHRDGIPKTGMLGLHGALVFFAAMFLWRDSVELMVADVFAFLIILGILTLPVMGLKLQRSGVAHYALGAFYAGMNVMLSPFLLIGVDIKWAMPNGKWAGTAASVLRGVAVAVPLILIFGGLFMAADAAYQRLIEQTFNIDFPTIITHLLLTSFLSWIAAGYLRGASFLTVNPANGREPDLQKLDLDLKEESSEKPAEKRPFDLQNVDNDLLPPAFRFGAMEIGIVLGLMNLLFLSFVIVQVPYLFGGMELVQNTENFKLADYARRGFFELVWVAALVLPVLLAAHWLIKKESKTALRIYQVLATMQVALLFVIMLSAAQRMMLYTGTSGYGLTTMRFYPMAFMIWLAVVFVWFAATVLRGQRQYFAWGTLWSAMVFLALLHVFNPDNFIARTNFALMQAGRGFDARYLHELSDDALPVILNEMQSLGADDKCVAQYNLMKKSETLWKETDLRSWNWSRWNGRQQLRLAVNSFDLTGCDLPALKDRNERSVDHDL